MAGAAYGFVLAGALGISFSPIFVALAQAPPTPAAFWRMVYALPWIAPFLLRARARGSLREGRWIPLAALAGVFFAVDLALYHRSIGLLGAGPATLLANTQVLWLALAGALFLREPPSPAFWASLPFAALGLWLLAGGDLQRVPALADRRGLALGLGSGASYAASLLCLRAARRGAEPASEAVLCVQVLVTLLAAAALALAEGTLLVPLRPAQHGWLMLLGLVPQALGWWAITRGIARLPGHHAGLLLLAQPLSSLWLGRWILDQPLGALRLAGFALVLLAVGATLLSETRSR